MHLKKIALLSVFSFFMIVMASCESVYSMEKFIQVAESYAAKLDELSTTPENEENTAGYQSARSSYLLSIDPEDPHMHPKEDFLDVYYQQPGMQFDINRSSFLMIYKNLLDEVVKELKDQDIIKLDVFIEIEFESYGDMKLYCGFSDEDEIVVKMDYQLDNMRMFSAFKTGYEGDQFYVKEMNYYGVGEDISYGYTEYQEENYYFQLSFYNASEYIYHYISEVDHQDVLVNRLSATEAEVSMSGYQISWKDYLNQNEFNYTINDEMEVIAETIVFFNDYATVFHYEDWSTLDSDIILRWNLIEASGWDYAYVPDEYSSPDRALYKDGVDLFPNDSIGAYITPNFVSLQLIKRMTNEEINDNLLDLSQYGLTFSMQELSMEYLNSVRAEAIETVLEFDLYSNLNIFDEDFTDSFIDLIDSDLSYIK
jgi:hypothetical protein